MNLKDSNPKVAGLAKPFLRIGLVVYLLSLPILHIAFLSPDVGAATWGYNYKLPYRKGETYTVSRAWNAHPAGVEKYAVDFGMRTNTPVVAVKAGNVKFIRLNSNIGGCDPKYSGDGNYIVLQHDDGLQSYYTHLSYNSAQSNLAIGTRVLQGQPLALSGTTGYSCGAHLHFQIQTPCAKAWCQSVPFSMDDVPGGEPKAGKAYTSDNSFGGSSPSANQVRLKTASKMCLNAHYRYDWSPVNLATCIQGDVDQQWLI